MNVSLKQFLKSGDLGQIHLGTSTQEVLERLGTPDYGDVTLQDQEKRNWKYGNFWLSLGDGEIFPQGVWCIEWHPNGTESDLPASCVLEDWEITADMTPMMIKTYLRDNGLDFRKRSSKGYFARQNIDARKHPELAEVGRTLGFLTFKKPTNEEDILRVMTFVTFFLASGVRISFVDEQLTSIMLQSKI